MRGLFFLAILVGLSIAAAAGEVRFEARVESVSAIPDPARSDYPHCLFAVKVSPRVPVGQPACSVVLVLEAFRDRKLTPHAALSESDVIRVHALPFEEMPKEYQSLQLVDDTLELDLPVVAGLRVARMDTFSSTTGWAWRGLEESASDTAIRSAVRFPAAQVARQATLERDLRAIEAKRAAHGSWAAWYDSLAPVREPLLAELAASPTQFLRRDGCYVFRFGGALEYKLLDSDATYQNILKSLQATQREFAKLGTDLIVLPIPMRDQVYASKFIAHLPEDGVLQPYWLKFHHDLLSRGIEVVDVLPAYRDALGKEEFLYHYNTTDGHPAMAGVQIAADLVSERLMRYWYGSPRRAYGTQESWYKNYDLTVLFPLDTPYPRVAVGEAGGATIQIVDVSEVLLMGDSMVGAPAGARHSQLLHQFVLRLGFPVSMIKRAGGAHEINRSLYRDVGMDYLSGRKVCIFAFAFSSVSQGNRTWSAVEFVSGRKAETAP